MLRLPRLLAPVMAVAAVAAVAPSAYAATTATFSNATVEITDPGSSSPTVHLVATVTDPSHLADTRVFLGLDSSTPDYSIGVDGVRDAVYDDSYDGELSTYGCSIYDGTRMYSPAVTAGADSFSVDLPKGEIIGFESAGVAVGDIASDTPCDNGAGFHGVTMDYPTVHQTIDGFSWDAPAAPAVTAAGGRRAITLSFDQEPGTQYDIYRVVDGARETDPFVANVRGDGSQVPVVIDQDPDGNQLDADTAYQFQVQATRLFNVWQGSDMIQPTSPFSTVVSAATAPVQTVRFVTTPPATTSDTTAQLTWVMDGNSAGEAPWCWLDDITQVSCTATGASLTGLTLGQHKLSVYPADGERSFEVIWSVVAAPAPAPAPVAPAPVVPPVVVPTPAPQSTTDLDGDGIENTWLVAGKPVAAPKAPKARVSSKAVKLRLPKLAKAVKGAKKVRIYRADGKHGFKLVGTVSRKGRKFTDRKIKRGHTYRYKTVAVNAKGRQSKASKPVKVKVRRKK